MIETLSFLVAAAGIIAAGIACYVSLSLKAELAEQELRTRNWINGSFMRSSAVEANLKALHVEIKSMAMLLERK
jgi:hypothetical protein